MDHSRYSAEADDRPDYGTGRFFRRRNVRGGRDGSGLNALPDPLTGELAPVRTPRPG